MEQVIAVGDDQQQAGEEGGEVEVKEHRPADARFLIGKSKKMVLRGFVLGDNIIRFSRCEIPIGATFNSIERLVIGKVH